MPLVKASVMSPFEHKMKSLHHDLSASRLPTSPTNILHSSPTNVLATTHHGLLIQAFPQVKGSSNSQTLILGTIWNYQTPNQLPRTYLKVSALQKP